MIRDRCKTAVWGTTDLMEHPEYICQYRLTAGKGMMEGGPQSNNAKRAIREFYEQEGIYLSRLSPV